MEPTNRFPHVRCAVLFILFLLPGAAASAAPVTGLGLMGDSVLDEYRFPQFLPPGGFRPWTRNVPEILSNLRDTNLGPYSFDSRGAPRHQGFAFNWALDGSTSADLIADGQHIGLAQQVAAGQVNLAWIWIGANDFRELYSPDVIQGPDPGGAIQAKVVSVATNVQIAIQTILAAHPAVNVVIANMPDLRATPALKAAIASTPGLEIFAAGVDQGIQAYNAQIAALAAGSDRIAMVDAYGISQPAVAGEPVQLGDLTLDTNIPGTGAEHYFVDVLHPGTAASGILANAFINASNAEFDSGLVPLGDQEIADYARAVPLPAPLYAGMIGLAGAGLSVLRARRRRAAA